MKAIIFLFLLVPKLLSQSASQTTQKDESDSGRTEIILLGTLHEGHNDNVYYSAKELRRIIVFLNPAAILIEIPKSQMGADGRVLESDLVGPELKVADQVARELNIPQLPFDDQNRNELNSELNRRSGNIQTSSARISQEIKQGDSTKLDRLVLQLKTDIERTIMQLQRRASPTIVNSDAYDALFRTKYFLDQDISISIVQNYPGHEDLADYLRYNRGQWGHRNTTMVENIVKAARAYSGKRLVVLTGAAHRYILHNLLTRQQGIVLREFWQVLH